MVVLPVTLGIIYSKTHVLKIVPAILIQ